MIIRLSNGAQCQEAQKRRKHTTTPTIYNKELQLKCFAIPFPKMDLISREKSKLQKNLELNLHSNGYNMEVGCFE